MAFQIEKITVDGVVFVGCRLTGTDGETQAEGVAEATIASAPSGSTLTVTAVASPTSSPQVGPSRSGIDYTGRGRLMRDAVDGCIYHLREMVRQRGGFVARENYDTLVPIRGRGKTVPARRYTRFGLV